MVDILTAIREKISCPQFGDNHYGEWGSLPSRYRMEIKRLLDYSIGQEAEIERLSAELEAINDVLYPLPFKTQFDMEIEIA
jgi:hypothetical protein